MLVRSSASLPSSSFTVTPLHLLHCALHLAFSCLDSTTAYSLHGSVWHMSQSAAA